MRALAALALLVASILIFACRATTEPTPEHQPGQCYDLPEGRACE